MKLIKNKIFLRFIFMLLAFIMLGASTISAYADFEGESVASSKTNSSTTYSMLYGKGTYNFPPFSFYDYNIGSNKTINGNRMRVLIKFKSIDGLYNNDCADIMLEVSRYDGLLVQSRNLCFLASEPDSDGYRYYELPWINVSYGVDYYINYTAYTCCSAESRRVHCYVSIEIE